MEVILMAYPKNFLFGANGSFWFRLQNVSHILSHNSGSAVRIVLQFCTMKGAKKDMEIILMDWKKS